MFTQLIQLHQNTQHAIDIDMKKQKKNGPITETNILERMQNTIKRYIKEIKEIFNNKSINFFMYDPMGLKYEFVDNKTIEMTNERLPLEMQIKLNRHRVCSGDQILI